MEVGFQILMLRNPLINLAVEIIFELEPMEKNEPEGRKSSTDVSINCSQLPGEREVWICSLESYEDSTLENAANGHSTPRDRKVLTSNVTIQKNLEQIFMITRLVNFLHFVTISKNSKHILISCNIVFCNVCVSVVTNRRFNDH